MVGMMGSGKRSVVAFHGEIEKRADGFLLATRNACGDVTGIGGRATAKNAQGVEHGVNEKGCSTGEFQVIRGVGTELRGHVANRVNDDNKEFACKTFAGIQGS